MTLLAYIGNAPVTVEGHSWAPGEARYVAPDEAHRMIEWGAAKAAEAGPKTPNPFRADGGETPAISTDVRHSPTDRMLRAPSWARPGGGSWR